jgi:hypothetical protein
MTDRTRPFFDRRSGEDRRKAYTEGYFLAGGTERRSGKERRQPSERRKGWTKISKWTSIKRELLKPDFRLDDD